ncbi:polyprenyl diphosphate synthase [Haloarchaeobius sp. DT45]|uniref:polyprenyl diphosphate synthase n=1 Tax=Haloarchaeobius sp. DT45 TaxID=3446116 RepID=UPI003F6A57F5
MRSWLRRQWRAGYERLLRREISGTPTHVAVIQDGNRRYARENGGDAPDGHREGANTAEKMLRWCQELEIDELTLYTFSTENFDRPQEELEPLFDLLAQKLREFADNEKVHQNEVRVRTIGDVSLLPERVRSAVRYADERTGDYDEFVLNIALAYGGRNELLTAARTVVQSVDEGDLDPTDIDVAAIEDRLYGQSVRDVDLIIRTGGDERTSNFLPWHANGNEAAVFFCAPYWPEFSKVDFLRAIRTYENREQSWRQTRARRALALLRAFGTAELEEARSVADRFRDSLSGKEHDEAARVAEDSQATEEPHVAD